MSEKKNLVLEALGYGPKNEDIVFEAFCRWVTPKDSDIDFDSGFEIISVSGDSFKERVKLIPKRAAGFSGIMGVAHSSFQSLP